MKLAGHKNHTHGGNESYIIKQWMAAWVPFAATAALQIMQFCRNTPGRAFIPPSMETWLEHDACYCAAGNLWRREWPSWTLAQLLQSSRRSHRNLSELGSTHWHNLPVLNDKCGRKPYLVLILSWCRFVFNQFPSVSRLCKHIVPVLY